MEDFDAIVAEVIRSLLSEGASGVVVIITDFEGGVYSQWALPKGTDTSPIGRVFEKIEGNGTDYVLH